MAELDMDVFSKHIGPYFSWLESKIETGWQQSDSVPKDVLKEVRSVATTMRARFILGVSRGDFSKEVERALEVLELACEAFPHESDEIEVKMQALASGIAEKIGNDLVPGKYRVQKTQQTVEIPKVVSEKPKIFEHKVETPKVVTERKEALKTERKETVLKKIAEPKVEKLVVKVTAPKPQVKPVQVKVAKPKVESKKAVVKKAAPELEKARVKKSESSKPVKSTKESKPNKRSFLSRAFRSFIYGEKP